jgi:pectinesterase
MSNMNFIFYVLVVLLVLQNPIVTQCHTKGIRPRPSNGIPLISTNMTKVQESEQQFMKWVKFVGGLKHTVFRTAKNKLFPSYTLNVYNKKSGKGGFSSIQSAIDSLPFINLVRVVIKVHAGVYT